MVSDELKYLIKSGKVIGKITDEEPEDKELSKSFAPFSEWIARGAMSHSKAFPELKEVSRDVSKTCRAIMKIARNENKVPTECIDKGCEITEMEVSDLIEELDNLSRGLKPSQKRFKGRGKTTRPTCPTCGEDLKNAYETQKDENGKQHWIKIGKQCKSCKYMEWI
jgi:hypothetical protein